jgi:hypothetical protein
MLVEDMAMLSKDPYKWVLYAFPWGQGELAGYDGPDEWSKQMLFKIRDGLLTKEDAIRVAVASGHGIGKSALVSWIILWSLSTLEGTRVVVTANTEAQLKNKTWSELAKWFGLMICKHWFKFTATAIHVADPDPEKQKTWRADMIPWSEHNTEAFAGLHNQGKRIVVLMDEASAVADKIWEVTEGALTDKDTEIIWCCFGNPTRNTGRFFDCFNKYRHRWHAVHVDSRTVKITNKKQLQEWVDDYGEDSDFVKVRVRGLFPSAGDRQFIPSHLVDKARGRTISNHAFAYAPIVIGVDPSYCGGDECVVYLRQGLMSKRLAVYRKLEDDLLLAGYVAQFEDEYKADKVFVDMGYGTGVVSAGKAMGRQWMLIPFAMESNDVGFLNKRAEMWNNMKKWLAEGGCLEDDPIICQELTGPEYAVKLDGKIKLESKDDMKKRGLASPNRADALCLTFAFPVTKKNQIHGQQFHTAKKEYDPLA